MSGQKLLYPTTYIQKAQKPGIRIKQKNRLNEIRSENFIFYTVLAGLPSIKKARKSVTKIKTQINRNQK